MKRQINLLQTVSICFVIVFNARKTENPPPSDFNSIPGRYSPKVALDWMDLTTEIVTGSEYYKYADAANKMPIRKYDKINIVKSLFSFIGLKQL